MARPSYLGQTANYAGAPVARIFKEPIKIDWYLSRGLLTDRQHQAAVKFARWWEIAHGHPKVTASLNDAPKQTVNEYNQQKEDATTRIRIALNAAGCQCHDVIVQVCGLDEWPKTTMATFLLRSGLDAIANRLKLPN